MITLEHLYFVYKNKPLFNDFSLSIPDGDKIVFYGPSGSGKSTLLMSMAGFVLPKQGNIIINNLKLNSNNINAIRGMIAWVPQEFTLPYESVRELIHAPFEFKKNMACKPSEEQILNYFEQLGLEPELLSRKIVEISGGQRQRIMIVTAALLCKPLLLMDEPTSSLDPVSVEKLANFIMKMNRTTVVAVSHDERFISHFKHKYFISNE